MTEVTVATMRSKSRPTSEKVSEIVKSLPLATVLCALSLTAASAQQPRNAKRPPVGIPVDSRLFNGKWYRLYPESIQWKAARAKCVTLGGQLAVVPDAATWEFLREYTSGASVWLGATDEALEGVWLWVDGSKLTFKNWNAPQPDNAGGNEHYMAMNSKGWSDIPNTGRVGSFRIAGFICEWKDK